MKVTLENKKGLNKNLKVFVDKETMNSYLEEKYEEVKKNVVLKGFRPGKVPKEILKKQFGQAILGEVLDKVLKDTTTKVLEDKKIRPAGQPKIDLKSYGENKDLEYTISVTELPSVEIKSIENINYNEYLVKIDSKETEKRIEQIAKNQNNFKDASTDHKSQKGNLVIIDYNATVDGKKFKGSEGKNTQLVLGKDLFIKGFDEQLIGLKKGNEKKVESILPENFPEKELAKKKAIFLCKILNIKIPEKVKIDDGFAKSLGAKDLKNLKELISKQINEEYKNSLDALSKKKILEQIAKFKVDEIPENLIEEEIKILSQGMKEDEINNKKNDLINQAKKRIKTGLILNEFGEKNNIKISEQEIQTEIQKQLRMMPGQENIVKEYYEKNPSALTSLRGSLYEEKILQEIKLKAKSNIKEITKEEAEKILKEENERQLKEHKHHDHQKESNQKTEAPKKTQSKKSAKSAAKKTKKAKKVSKK